MPTLADYPGYAREGRTLNGSCPGTRDDAGTPARAKGHTVALVAGSVTVTGGAAVWSTPARAHTEYERAVAPKVLQCFATFLRTSLKAGATAGLVTTHVSPLDVGDEGSEVHVVVPLRYRGHAFTIYLDAAFYRISNATGSLSIVAWPREYSPGLFHAELDRLAERGRAALRAT